MIMWQTELLAFPQHKARPEVPIEDLLFAIIFG
jgi:hypothetical protein